MDALLTSVDSWQRMPVAHAVVLGVEAPVLAVVAHLRGGGRGMSGHWRCCRAPRGPMLSHRATEEAEELHRAGVIAGAAERAALKVARGAHPAGGGVVAGGRPEPALGPGDAQGGLQRGPAVADDAESRHGLLLRSAARTPTRTLTPRV